MSFDRIVDWSMTKIEIPFRVPFTIITGDQKLSLKSRPILLLKVNLSSGISLVSEAHPLPGLHPESISFCQQELETFLQSIAQVSFAFPPTGLEFLEFFDTQRLSGPGRVAFEGLFLPFLLPYPTQVLCQKLIVPDFKEARPLSFADYSHLKIKLGRLDFQQELSWLLDLHQDLPTITRWRLDGNQQLTADQLLQLSAMPFKNRIDYIEEPLSDFFKNFCVTDKEVSPLPFALDESLKMVLDSGLNLKQLRLRGLKAFIIRPPSLGGYGRALKAVQLADSFNLISVISSSFEGPWGFERLLHLLSAPVQSLSKAEAHGLDTLTSLDFDQLHARMANISFLHNRSSK